MPVHPKLVLDPAVKLAVRVLTQRDADLAAVREGLPHGGDPGTRLIHAAAEHQGVHVDDERQRRCGPKIISCVDQTDPVAANRHINDQRLPGKLALEIRQVLRRVESNHLHRGLRKYVSVEAARFLSITLAPHVGHDSLHDSS